MKKTLYVVMVIFLSISMYGYYKLPKEMERKGCFSPDNSVKKKGTGLEGLDEVSVLMIGDAGMGNENQHLVAAASEKTCEELGCDMALYLGDNFYPSGVENIEDFRFSEWFENVYPQNIPFYAVLGNHDVKGNWRAQIAYTDKSQRWTMPDVNYRFSAGPVQFYAINTNCSQLALANLETDEVSPWKVIVGHKPYVSSGNHSNLDIVATYFLERLDFDFYIAGHQHMLEHLEKKGRDVIVSGGGGAELQEQEKEISTYSAFATRSHGYVWASFKKDSADVVFFDREGEKIYEFSRKR